VRELKKNEEKKVTDPKTRLDPLRDPHAPARPHARTPSCARAPACVRMRLRARVPAFARPVCAWAGSSGFGWFFSRFKVFGSGSVLHQSNYVII